MSNSTNRNLARVVLCIFFIVCICLPLLDLAVGLDRSAPLRENRTLASMPDLASPVTAVLRHPTDMAAWTKLRRAVMAFPAAFNSYYNDNFGLRKLLVRAHSQLMLLGWPAKGDVIVGKEGWLFLGEPAARESYQSSVPFSAQELANWQKELERRRDWLAAHGSDYVLVIAPEKSTIYTERMPGSVPRIGQTTRMDQLLQYLGGNSSLKVVDLRDALTLARSRYQTYYRTDTHWNAWGAYNAYTTIQLQLAGDHPFPRPWSTLEYTFEEKSVAGGDLAGMLGLEKALSDTDVVAQRMVPGHAQVAETHIPPLANMPIWSSQPVAREVPGLNAPTMIMFSDSFGEALIPYFAEDYSRSLYLNRYGLDEDTILRERPGIVIQEIAERALQMSKPPEGNGL